MANDWGRRYGSPTGRAHMARWNSRGKMQDMGASLVPGKPQDAKGERNEGGEQGLYGSAES